jgi:hypothetical protein
VAEEDLELVLVVLMAKKSPAVDIEVAAGDRRVVASEPGELADGVLGDQGQRHLQRAVAPMVASQLPLHRCL